MKKNETKKTVKTTNAVELNEEELDNVAGGVLV